MEENQYGLTVKYQTRGYNDTHPAGDDLPTVKSTAELLFSNEDVISTCVYDNHGVARLYLKKTPEGIVREER